MDKGLPVVAGSGGSPPNYRESIYDDSDRPSTDNRDRPIAISIKRRCASIVFRYQTTLTNTCSTKLTDKFPTAAVFRLGFQIASEHRTQAQPRKRETRSFYLRALVPSPGSV